MKYLISNNSKILKGEIKLPASKSISNRLLIIQAICDPKFKISNLSESEDTKVLVKALTENNTTIDIGHAGTSMRFLTTFFASHKGEKVLTGSYRMKERPIGYLVEALQKLGAEIEYLENPGFPPLFIKGKKMAGGKVAINSSISSQFISSLLLSAPLFKNGIELHLEEQVVSSSYIDLTLKIMEYMGIKVEKLDNQIKISPQQYTPRDIFVEGDWSAVSYWYEAAAIAKEAELFIYDLKRNSFQGDCRCASIFSKLGVRTEYFSKGIKISNSGKLPSRFDFDFIETPDLVQTIVVTCVLLGIPFRLTGTQSLRIKETDRITALQKEINKFGAIIHYEDNGILEWDGKLNPVKDKEFNISTYQDHRMAMAFAPIALLKEKIIIENPEVVVKSYPSFWDDFENLGFEVDEV